MKKGTIIFLAVGAILVLGVFYAWSFYNSMITLNEQVDTQWAQVETQYQRRVDLIPNLVDTVKGVAKQEQTVFGQIAEARTRYSGATSPAERVSAANQLESSLARLLVIVEQYPQLNSSQSFQTLMAQLEGTENRIATERGRFNEIVRDYNIRAKRFPGVIFAGIFGFGERELFAAEEGAENAPDVEF